MISKNQENQTKKSSASFIFIVILAGLFVIGLLLASLSYVKFLMKPSAVEVSTSEHGCLDAEGYVWCELKKACIHAETEKCVVMEEVYKTLGNLYAQVSDSEYLPVTSEFLWQQNKETKSIPTPLKGLLVLLDTVESTDIEKVQAFLKDEGFEESPVNKSIGENVQFYGYEQLGGEQVCLLQIMPKGYDPASADGVSEERMLMISCGLTYVQAVNNQNTEETNQDNSVINSSTPPQSQGNDE